MAKLVNWRDFERKMKEKKMLLFSPFDVQKIFPVSKVAVTFLLHRYATKGFIERLRRGLYVFPDAIPPEAFIANKLYEPSYVSLEFALSYHRVIPETVYAITSVTPKATRRFEALGKIFSYRRIIKQAFTGYTIEKQNGFSFHIADAEKALVDALYYRLRSGQKPFTRLNKEKINTARTLQHAKLFRNQKLLRVIENILR